MPATAKRLNLTINWWVDERRDPIKSTQAAALYLKYLYKRFKSWNLALAAYNAGEGRISSALRRSGKRDFWSLRKTGLLARETKNYIPSFIAATAIAMHPEQFGIRRIDYHEPLRYEEVPITSAMDLEVVARFSGTTARKIRELNPELRRMCTPPNVESYTLRIPEGTKRKFLKNLERTRGKESEYVNLYTVKAGDTVQHIADSIGATIQTITEMNALGRRALIHVGKQLLVPLEADWSVLR
jgi:membrane-bound lytic murein transglycosylase D